MCGLPNHSGVSAVLTSYGAELKKMPPIGKQCTVKSGRTAQMAKVELGLRAGVRLER